MGLTKNEITFYNALETSNSVVKVLGDDTLLPKLISGHLRIKEAEQIIGNIPDE